jgi:hypothetical protein
MTDGAAHQTSSSIPSRPKPPVAAGADRSGPIVDKPADRHRPLDVDRGRQKAPCLVGCQIDAQRKEPPRRTGTSTSVRADATLPARHCNRTTPTVDSAVSATTRCTPTQLSRSDGHSELRQKRMIVSERRDLWISNVSGSHLWTV